MLSKLYETNKHYVSNPIRTNSTRLKIRLFCEKCKQQDKRKTKQFNNFRSLYYHYLYHHSGADKFVNPTRDQCIKKLQLISDTIDKRIITHQKITFTKNRTTPYSPTYMSIMDFFLKHPALYFTPMTVYKSIHLNVTPDTIKNCMNLLLRNNYLTKENGAGTNHYNITKENMEFWVNDFRRYILAQEELRDTEKIQLKQVRNDNE